MTQIAMKRVAVKRVAIFGLVLVAAATALAVSARDAGNQPPNGPIPITLFGMHINRPVTPWPAVHFGALRLWDTGTGWSQINNAPGKFEWRMLDRWLQAAKEHNVDVMYTMGRTPPWAQCGSDTPSSCQQQDGGGNCAYNSNVNPNGGGNGQCYWPGDLNKDGSGANQHWKDWVTALVKHSVEGGGGRAHIKYYEIWNEYNVSPPTGGGMWQGTDAQLARMTKDTKCIVQGLGADCHQKGIDPEALIVTPSPVLGVEGVNRSMKSFLAAGGGDGADAIGIHTYVGPDAALMGTLIETVQKDALSHYQQTGKPLFSTEGSWGARSNFYDSDERAGYVAQAYMIHWARGVSRFYWYIWEDLIVNTAQQQPRSQPEGYELPRPQGQNFLPSENFLQFGRPGPWQRRGPYGGQRRPPGGQQPVRPSQRGCSASEGNGEGLCKDAVAYGEVEKWMVGAVMSDPCKKTGPGEVWGCGFTRDGGYKALAVWDSSKKCQQGKCETRDLKVDNTYVHYRDLDGTTHEIISHTVPAGYKPILLENR